MSEGMTIKIGFTIVGSLVFGSIVAFRSRREEGKDDYGYRPRYLGYVSGAILPAAVLSWAILFFLCYGGRAAAQALLSACFGISSISVCITSFFCSCSRSFGNGSAPGPAPCCG